MEWIQILIFIFGNLAIIIPMFLWSRAESRADIRHFESKLETQLIAIRQEVLGFNQAVRLDIKDFHGRLCAIEERRLKERKNID